MSQQFLLVVAERILGGHLQIAVVTDRLNEPACSGITGDHRRSGVPTFQDVISRIQTQPSGLFFCVVTFETFFDQQRANL